ncbi:Arogenate dehydratase/prephenate dehydratase 1 [Capnocytophaga canimorsus]|uniref:prephenate dehydratase n=1 Tax=Capnocytophaga canimorsus TaxID=28188 RepID=A0A0B7HJ21_9FLAO|nr:prephenate dehydratase [Capnocytophaga canimorsus]ATA77826.1 prephenate dehydratase [Capnocytophaga canimorsus]PJI79719.1 prephenate dehydratase [Capnocytophaga canimorsus]CEN39696.1 Arogenate dehydratase/prephenate dehydratase 1 [Capnocytophaga canimorsus]STA73118.1 P-protein [Capnocytophaga canimorsus]
MQQKIAIQGIKGSFHYQAAQEYFGNQITIIECNSFDKVAQSLLKNEADLGVMAIENSIAGSILPNYALIDRLKLNIVGEHYIDIQQNLMAISGQDLNDLKEVHSHPMALLQCKQFFENYPHIKLVEDTDTASTAQRIHQKQLLGIGAIGSKSAAELYNLEIIRHSIQTMKINATRFVILTTKEEKIDRNQVNKASLKFQVHHKRGSLATVLNVISDCRINMTKIQSLPVIETPWKYAFFVDIVFENYEDFEKAEKLLSIMAEDFKVLGIYKNALI